MSFDIPRQYEPKIRQFAQSQHITTDEALNRIIQAGLERVTAPVESPRVSYVALFGAANGPGTRKSREEVDRYIAELRNEW